MPYERETFGSSSTKYGGAYLTSARASATVVVVVVIAILVVLTAADPPLACCRVAGSNHVGIVAEASPARPDVVQIRRRKRTWLGLQWSTVRTQPADIESESILDHI
jgi:hypothetical protein